MVFCDGTGDVAGWRLSHGCHCPASGTKPYTGIPPDRHHNLIVTRSAKSGEEANFMVEKDSIFLTIEQAIAAVCLDFRQYEPQVLLFSEIISVLSKGDIIAKREIGKNGMVEYFMHIVGNKNPVVDQQVHLLNF